MSLLQLHDGLANACVIFSLLVGGYGFWRYFRKEGVGSNYWGVLATGELLYLAQGGVGALLFLNGLRPARTAVHILYGALLMLVLPAAYAYTRGQDGRREALIYGLIGLFLTGVALRAIITAG